MTSSFGADVILGVAECDASIHGITNVVVSPWIDITDPEAPPPPPSLTPVFFKFEFADEEEEAVTGAAPCICYDDRYLDAVVISSKEYWEVVGVDGVSKNSDGYLVFIIRWTGWTASTKESSLIFEGGRCYPLLQRWCQNNEWRWKKMKRKIERESVLLKQQTKN